jgi:hypothetical protein
VTDPAPDVVIPVREGEPNDGLRYVLRSLAVNVPHATVWIAGYCPRWVTGVRHVPVRQRATKWQNSTANLRAAVDQPELGDRFVFACDDTFVLAPVEEIPVMHRGPVAELIADYQARGVAGRYVHGMAATARFLDWLGVPDPLSYEVHAPIPMDKAKAREALELPARHRQRIVVLHKRTLYGAYWRIGGHRVVDPKLRTSDTAWPEEWTYVSTSRGMMAPGQPVGDRIRDLFPDPSPYEARPAKRRVRPVLATAPAASGRPRRSRRARVVFP